MFPSFNRILALGAAILLSLGLYSCSPGATPAGGEVSATPTAASTPNAGLSPQAPSQPVLEATAERSQANLRVVYALDGQLWVWDGSTPRTLTDTGSDSRPLLSDDGSRIAFVRQGQLWAIQSDGSKAHALSAPGLVIDQFIFLPNTQNLYFSTAAASDAPVFDLYRVDVDAGQPQQLLAAGQGGRWVFSPDSARMALLQPDKINLAAVDGSQLQTVLSFTPLGNLMPQAAWLSNGYGFKAVLPSTDPNTQGRYMFVPAEAGSPAQLALIPPLSTRVEPAFLLAPDSDKVAYLRERAGNLELHLIDASTADRLLDTQPAIGLFGWSPDGTTLAFWRGSPASAWVLQADGTISPVADSAGVTRFAWLADGRFVFAAASGLYSGAPGQPNRLLLSENPTDFSAVPLP